MKSPRRWLVWVGLAAVIAGCLLSRTGNIARITQVNSRPRPFFTEHAPAAATPVTTPATVLVAPTRAESNMPPETVVPPAVIQESLITFAPGVRDWKLEGTTATDGFNFELFDGQEYSVSLSRHESTAPDCGIIEGEVKNHPGSHVLLAYVGEATAGTISAPGLGLFQIRYAGNGQHRITQLDPEKIPPCGNATLPAMSSITHPAPTPEPEPPVEGDVTAGNNSKVVLPPTKVSTITTADALPATPADAPTTVDLLVVYTPAVASANGGAAGVAALINAAIASANTSYAHSGVGLTLRLVHSAQISYTGSGNLSTDLTKLQSTSDGVMDQAHTLRDQYKADVVCLLVPNGGAYAGLGYLWTPGAGAGFASYGFSVVVAAYADSNLTLAHEVGHNMGCGHAVEDGGGGAYSYSYGWKFSVGGTAYRTVMAYAPGMRITYFSNPSVSYLGVPTGTANANNALGLQNSKGTIAQFRSGLTVLDQQWTPVASADFDADDQTDVLWRNTSSGKVIVWLMNGTTRVSTATLWSGDASWNPVATSDFNADGKPDILWRQSTTGRVIVWLMNGTSSTGTVTIWTGDAAWVPITTGDFNADGKPDIVWRHSANGRVIVWLMNGTTLSSTVTLWSSDAAWRPVATGDFNADGKTDLLWRNVSTGRVIVWLMNGTTMASSSVIWSGDASWIPLATANLAGDSGPDIVWRQSSTGRVVVWVMSGTTMSSTTAIWQ